MSNVPLISVISASWNQGRYLEECLKSVESLGPSLVEHIVIDNCSDDQTHNLLKRYPHVRAIIEPDGGQSEALNKGFRAARGEWILWLNVDDFLLPGSLEVYQKMIGDSRSDFDIIYGHMVFVDSESKRIKTVYQPQWYYWMTRNAGFVAPSTGSLYRKEILINEPLNHEFHIIMDTEWMLRAGKNLRVKRIRREMAAFRIADNKTAQHIQEGTITPQHRAERLQLVERYPDYPADLGEKEPFLGYLRRTMYRGMMRGWIKLDKAISFAIK